MRKIDTATYENYASDPDNPAGRHRKMDDRAETIQLCAEF